jgi:acetyl esterase/lipase
MKTAGAQRIGLIGFSAGGHLAGLAALAPGAAPDETVQFAVLGYAVTSMQTETYRPAWLILREPQYPVGSHQRYVSAATGAIYLNQPPTLVRSQP